MVSSVNNYNINSYENCSRKPLNPKKVILAAIAALMTFGFLLSCFFGAPWLVAFGFFAMALIPLFPLWRIKNSLPNRIE